MQLINGPLDKKVIKDLGKVVVRIGIASKWKDGKPAIGSRSGNAIYEPSKNRKKAFWLENQWEGTTQKII